MDFKRNARYFDTINWKYAIIGFLVGLVFLAIKAFLGVLIIAAAGAYIYFKLKGQPTDAEIDAVIQGQMNAAKEQGFRKLGIDPDEVNLIDPIVIHGPRFRNINSQLLTKKGKDGWVRSSNHEIIVFFFSENQIYNYSYNFSMISNERNEGTDEYFYRDIVSIATLSTSHKYTDIKTKKEETVNHEVFRLTTSGGTSMECNMQSTDKIEQQVQGMKNLLREKKSAS